MWTRSGFILHIRRTGITAVVTHHLYPGMHRAELVQFKCGDYGWYSRGTFMAWPHQVRLCNRIRHVEVWGALSRSSPIDGPRLKAVA